jgi:aryl-alcohol dehydrogenase-like predicted oxidoreductase
MPCDRSNPEHVRHSVPAIGQGSWHIGQGRHPAAEEEALGIGLSLGMTLIDTSGNYGEGRSEED